MINGRYLLQEKIGYGGMGIVHRAIDRLTSEVVAIKQVHIPAEQLAFMSQTDTQAEQNLAKFKQGAD
ncbi:MAG: hypothetical protein AAF485_20715 [Chloroflexota bacterium]